MKAVILDRSNGRSVALTEDGTVREIKGMYSPGETLDIPAGHIRLPGWRRAAVVGMAACLMLVTGFLAWRSYRNNVAYAAVRLSGGPAIEYRLDQSNRVIAVTALESEAEGLAEEVSSLLAGQTFEETLEITFTILDAADIPEEARTEITAEVEVKDANRRQELEHTVERVKNRHRKTEGKRHSRVGDVETAAETSEDAESREDEAEAVSETAEDAAGEEIPAAGIAAEYGRPGLSALQPEDDGGPVPQEDSRREPPAEDDRGGEEPEGDLPKAEEGAMREDPHEVPPDTRTDAAEKGSATPAAGGEAREEGNPGVGGEAREEGNPGAGGEAREEGNPEAGEKARVERTPEVTGSPMGEGNPGNSGEPRGGGPGPGGNGRN